MMLPLSFGPHWEVDGSRTTLWAMTEAGEGEVSSSSLPSPFVVRLQWPLGRLGTEGEIFSKSHELLCLLPARQDFYLRS